MPSQIIAKQASHLIVSTTDKCNGKKLSAKGLNKITLTIQRLATTQTKKGYYNLKFNKYQ